MKNLKNPGMPSLSALGRGVVGWFVFLFIALPISLLAQNSDTQEAQLHYKVAQIALKNNDLNAATEELLKAAELAPRNALVQYYLAVAFKEQRRATEGLDHLRIAMKLGLPAKEGAAATNLLAELTYAAKLQPLTDVIGNWSKEVTSTFRNDNGCTSTETITRRIVVLPQNPQKGVLKAEYDRSQESGMITSGCTFNATGTRLISYEVKNNGTLSLMGDQVKFQFETGRCTGDCLGVDVNAFGIVEEGTASRDEMTLRYADGGNIQFVSETPTPNYLARKKAEGKAREDMNAADLRKTANLLAGRWEFESPTERHSWGTGCRGEKHWGESISFGNTEAGALTARGSDEQWFKDELTRDPESKCYLNHHLDVEINYRQSGSAVLKCDTTDSCKVSITYDPCRGGENCSENGHMSSPGQHDCEVSVSDISARSFTLRCGGGSQVFERP